VTQMSAADAAILDWSIPEIARLVRVGDVSAEEIARLSLERIAQQNGRLGAFLTVQAEQTIDAARDLDERRSRGERLGPLAGVPIGIKDALCLEGSPATAGPAGYPLEVPRVVRGAVGGVLGRGAHRELVHVAFAGK